MRAKAPFCRCLWDRESARPADRLEERLCWGASGPPPSLGKDPLGVGVEENPQQNGRRHQHQPEDLVAPVSMRLPLAPRLLGCLLVVGLDARLHHAVSLPRAHTFGAQLTTHQYRGRSILYIPTFLV